MPSDKPQSASNPMPSKAALDNLDRLFDGRDQGSGDLVADPDEMASRNKMEETGFDGRGVIKIRNSSRKPDLAYRLFIEQLNDDADHTQLKAALAQVATPAATRFLSLLFSPRHRKTRIETLAKMAGIGIPQLRDIWRQARLDQGFLNLLNEYPRAMKDVARDSRSTREMCRTCQGLGKIMDESVPSDRPAKYIACGSCSGRGWVRKAGDKDARSLMGQILGVSGKPSTPLLQANVNVNLESVISEIENIERRAGAGIYEGHAEEADESVASGE